MKRIFSKQSSFLWAVILLTGFYLLTHFFQLTKLPVFADEAIYIRWAQLIIDDPKQYLFFALNDGKTPLFIWSLVPFQFLFHDQLLSARFVSVLIGLMQMGLIGYLIRALGGKKASAFFGMLLVVVLPFWYFHHRMALMDGLLTVFLTMGLIAVVRYGQQLVLIKTDDTKKEQNSIAQIRESCRFLGSVFTQKGHWVWWLVIAFSVSLSFWTKLPTLIALPILPIFLFTNRQLTRTKLWAGVMSVSLAVVLGVILFGLLAFNPAFPQLFSRGGDFLHPVTDILFNGLWRDTLPSFPNYYYYLLFYLTPLVALSPLIGLLFKYNRRQQLVFLFSFLIFFIPIALMGKVVYPRYFLPVAVFFTLSCALVLDTALTWIRGTDDLNRKLLAGVGVALFVANILSGSSASILYAVSDIYQLPLVSADRVQYLNEWSAGQGIKEVADKLLTQNRQQTTSLATEGFFGTLPDGILLYLHRQNVDNILVEGIGQPVGGIPEEFLKKTQNYDQQWLLVNSHRMLMNLDSNRLIEEYCRGEGKPCLQLWDIKAASNL